VRAAFEPLCPPTPPPSPLLPDRLCGSKLASRHPRRPASTMASSPSPIAVFDVVADDEFDWEAAVREIDSACEGPSVSTSSRPQPAAPIPHPPVQGPLRSHNLGKPARGPRQSTLDKFVGAHGKCSKGGGPEDAGTDVGGDTGGEQVVAVDIDMGAAKTWIYPVNVPLRDYQYNIAQTALFSNTLVALPTGLGKTLIAAVAMYNYFRWFPGGKIVFTAPSRPLVMQQIEACHKIVGIPQEWTIDMTGQMNPQKRSHFWRAKRVFFVTPQVLEKDIQSGVYACFHELILLLAVPVQLRILALTATPGSKQQTIQNVINNLHISRLEYRNESDPDVSKYVHNRKLELIEVAMTKDAVEINNLLMEGTQPFARTLNSLGLLRGRDFATLSPCELLNSRDMFRQAPPSTLPSVRCNEVEACFLVLITLYHVRKLLSSHGIRPAYEMLAEKLKQGPFSRLTSRNENIWNAKRLMEQSLSHGAPNPKLEKLKEVLLDHFRMRDCKDSRVIIFSNFRGSVRDIMSSLTDMGEVIKATEFIGQSSGKALKGQTQKVQQAVLQKFRDGGYNVIVATSIGEEGLDIMEVDLVICFDANISPLRMIQRMGRTGRKHDGRGYQRKQANNKTVRKHMHNGGAKSFDFHPSPRMVPHICKPQVQYVELSIEQFVPRGKKAREGFTRRSPLSKKMSKEEKCLIDRYFHSSEDIWKPSLIAFPSFQAFASRVHKVRHSSKTTGMLIDAMQCLQGQTFSRDRQDLSSEVDTYSDQPMKIVTFAADENDGKAHETSITVHRALNEDLGVMQVEGPDSDKPPKVVLEVRDGRHMPKLERPSQQAFVLHHFLYDEDFVTVDVNGDVSISSVPVLSISRKAPHAKIVMMPDTFRPLEYPLTDLQGVKDASRLSCTDNEHMLASACPNLDSNVQILHGAVNTLFRVSVSEGSPKCLENSVAEVPTEARKVGSASQAIKSTDALDDMELSPRLTHFFEKGIVPESPTTRTNHSPCSAARLVDTGIIYEHEDCGLHYNPANIHERGPDPDYTRIIDTPVKNNNPPAPANDSPCTPGLFAISSSCGVLRPNHVESEEAKSSTCEIQKGKCNSSGPLSVDTPMVDKNSCKEDWQSSSMEVSRSVHQTPKYKRLRKHCDLARKLPCKTLEENFCASVKRFCQHAVQANLKQVKHVTGKRKDKMKVKCLIEEEAEVSSDAEVSEDENDDKDDDAYEDSFIDDRTNSAEASVQAKDREIDMMAFYRRSLLTQSPMAMESPLFAQTSVHELSPRTAETGSCASERISNSLQTPGNKFRCEDRSIDQNSVTYQMGPEKIDLPFANDLTSQQLKQESKLEGRKRKLSFQHVALVPEKSFQKDQLIRSDSIGTESVHCQPDFNSDVLSFDDEFYEGLDLDAVEAQATKILRYKSEISAKQKALPVSSTEVEGDSDKDFEACPSFDLGIHFS
ncbi:hypothetical protein Taro_005119, partial [Colocasia esculenta]|nr:hypothetical protein [Colocasia esculenta]